MTKRPKTIQIYLPGGDPQGIRVAEITTHIVRVIEVPRSLLLEFLKTQESTQVAVYFLIGSSDDEIEPSVYIGQSGDLRVRLAAHHKEKDFWSRALVLISLTNSLTQTHALFLEWLCLQEMREAERYKPANGNSGSKPHTPAPLEADCFEIFDTAKVLMATLGFPLFDPVAKAGSGSQDEDEIFYCSRSGTSARGRYTNEGFVVLKGSRGRKENSPSIIGKWIDKMRQSLLDAQIMVISNDMIEFTRDHLFKTPSGASSAVVGSSSNGWADWKTVDGKTLNEVKRQNVVVGGG